MNGLTAREESIALAQSLRDQRWLVKDISEHLRKLDVKPYSETFIKINTVPIAGTKSGGYTPAFKIEASNVLEEFGIEAVKAAYPDLPHRQVYKWLREEKERRKRGEGGNAGYVTKAARIPACLMVFGGL